MSLSKLKMISSDEVSLSRILAAFQRRISIIPHAILWKLASEGSTNNHQLRVLRDTHRGERCYIIGNGPSLANMDLIHLKDEITFGLNRIYLLFDKMGFTTTYYISMNELVIEQNAEAISNIRSQKFINWRMRRLLPEAKGVHYLLESYRPHFARDIAKGVWGGATVTYVAMQIAFYLGFRQVILIGVDHHFKSRGIPGKVVIANSRDPDHFDPKYFANGARWQLPDLKTAEWAYRLAKEVFESEGGEIVDATVGGKLDVFRKVRYQATLTI